jgi:hypothetical protein
MDVILQPHKNFLYSNENKRENNNKDSDVKIVSLQGKEER